MQKNRVVRRRKCMSKINNIKLIGIVLVFSMLFSSCGFGKMRNTKKTISKLENKEYYQKYLPKKKYK